MVNLPSQSEIKRQIEELTNFASAQPTLEALQKVSDAPEADRSRLAEELVTPKALAAKGVPLPKDTRVSLRVFEKPTNKSLGAYTYNTATGEQALTGKQAFEKQASAAKARSITVCASAGYFICVSVGGDTSSQPSQSAQ